jgi:hypothetical protein
VRDLSEVAMELAELDTCDTSLLDLGPRVVDLWLLTEVALCWETDRSRGSECDSTSMADFGAKEPCFQQA